uniref:Reverse transcriptase domain-containing protein n=1 Tax=Strongyloides papillosus TaxID=174720 RepID=A0A0N5BGQ9_STREA
MLPKKTKRPSIITDEISGLIRTRSIIFQDKSITNLLNYTNLNKLINYKIRNEKKKRDQTILESALKKNRAMKFVYIEKREFNHLNLSLLKPDGSMTTTIDEVNEEIKRHYKDLYAGLPLSNDWEKSVKNFETFKDFTLSHILQRIKKIKKKAPGTDGMSFAHYKLASNVLPTALLQRFNTYIHKGFPSLFKEASLILLKKPGNAKLITNTRPIAILQGNYKLFTSMLLDRIRNKIERNLDREQAGFRQRKNTITNTFILKTIMQKTTEFKIPLFIIFIDFKKAFDSIEHSYLFSTLGEMGLSLHEIKIIQELYKDSRMLIPCLRSSSIQIFSSKDVKQ